MLKDPGTDFSHELGQIGIGLSDAMALKMALYRIMPASDSEDDEPPPDFAPEPPVNNRPDSPPVTTKPAVDDGFVPTLVDQRVRVNGLEKKPELNGKFGKALRYDPSTGRYTIELEDDAACTYNLKPDNVTRAPTSASRLDEGNKSYSHVIEPTFSPMNIKPAGAASPSKPEPPPQQTAESIKETMEAAAQAKPFVIKQTKDGPRIVPASHARSNAQVMDALSAMGKVNAEAEAIKAAEAMAAAEQEQQAASAEVDDDYCDVSDARPALEDGGGDGEEAVFVEPPDALPLGTGATDLLASALAAVKNIDPHAASAGGLLSNVEERLKPVVRERTQINHVTPEGGGGANNTSSVLKGTSNKALEAYKRRQVDDPNKGVEAFELDKGTLNPAARGGGKGRGRGGGGRGRG